MISVEEFLAAVRDFSPCSCVGSPVTGDVVQVRDWSTAYRQSQELEWINFLTDRSNDFWDLGRFDEEDEKFHDDYNTRIRKVRDEIHSLVIFQQTRGNVLMKLLL